MPKVSDSCFSSYLNTSTPNKSASLPPWLACVLMIIVAVGALSLCNILSKTSDWSWLREGLINTKMQLVLAAAAVAEIALVCVALCCNYKKSTSAKSRQSAATSPPVMTIKLPLPMYYTPRKVTREFPGPASVYYHNPNEKIRNRPMQAGELSLSADLPNAPGILVENPNMTFAQLNKEIPKYGLSVPADYYFAVCKQEPGEATWTWWRAQNNDRLSAWLPFGSLWLLDTTWTLPSPS